MTKHILFLSLFLTCPSLSVQISISTALFSHLCLSVLVIPLISAVFLNSHHALSLQFTLSFLRISSTVLHKYENISFNLNFHPGTCFCFIRVHVFWRYVVPTPPLLVNVLSVFPFPVFPAFHHPSPSGPPVLLSPSLFVYLLIPVSASRGQSEDVCAQQKAMMSSLSALAGKTGAITRHRYFGLHNAASFQDRQPPLTQSCRHSVRHTAYIQGILVWL